MPVIKDRRLFVINVLTLMMSIAWAVGFVVRLFIPTWIPNPAVDAGMLLILGYWFSVNAVKKNGSEK